MADKPLHILIANYYMMRCGPTRFVCMLANDMVKRGHKVTIMSPRGIPKILYPFYKLGRKIHEMSLPEGTGLPLGRGSESLGELYELDPRVRVENYRFTDNNLKIQKLRKRIKAMDLDVAVLPLGGDSPLLVWTVAMLGSGVPVVSSEHCNPEVIEKYFLNRKSRLATMSGADAFHVLLPQYLESVPDCFRDKACAIPLPIEKPEQCANPAGIPGERKKLLWLARMQEGVKQCRMAIDAFALVAARFPDWDLHIVGDGEQRQQVEEHSAEVGAAKGISDRIIFHGDAKDVWPHYLSAQAFCISSRLEGLPTALLEARAAGLPAVGFAECPGVKEIIKHAEDGLLAPEMSPESLAAQLEIMLADENLRVKMGQKGRAEIDIYSPQAVFDQWDELLRKTAAKKGNTVMDEFAREPFASMARLSSCARREWLWRDFGKPMPGSLEEWVSARYGKIKRFFTSLLAPRNS